MIVQVLGFWDHTRHRMPRAHGQGEYARVADGRIGMWLDGKLIADFPSSRFRDIATLTIDYLSIGGYISPNQVRDNKLWYDDVVAATSYIGPRK